MRKIVIKIVSYFINVTKEIEKKNKEDLIVELLTLSGALESNMQTFKNAEKRYRSFLEITKMEQLEQAEIIKVFNNPTETTDGLTYVVEKIEACGYEIEFVKK